MSENLENDILNDRFFLQGKTIWSSPKNLTPFIQLSEDDVIRIVNHALANGNRTASYKFAFFKSILDNLFNVNTDTKFLSYDAIFLRFTEIYWNLVLRFHLSQSIVAQGKISLVERCLYEFAKKYGFPFTQKNEIFPFENLRSDLQLEITKIIKREMLKNVIGAFCGDTADQFYHYDKENKYFGDGIILNGDGYLFLVKYKTSFEKLNYYEWIKYLEKSNAEEDSYALASKLDSSTERADLSAYRNTLKTFGQARCFYCGKILDEKSKTVPVDHFIPWSFVKDDKLWNFALACPACNSSKSNILPVADFVTLMQERNDRLSNFQSPLVLSDFKNYSHFRLTEMYHSAVFNGFDAGWSPRTVKLSN